MRTRDTTARRMALAGALALGGALLLGSAGPAHAGATAVPAFQNGSSWLCTGATGGTPRAGSAVIGLTGSAKNPVLFGTAQMRGLAPNTTYTVRLYQSTGNACSFVSATDVTTNAQGNATVHLSAPRPSYTNAFLVAFNSTGSGWLSGLAPLSGHP